LPNQFFDTIIVCSALLQNDIQLIISTMVCYHKLSPAAFIFSFWDSQLWHEPTVRYPYSNRALSMLYPCLISEASQRPGGALIPGMGQIPGRDEVWRVYRSCMDSVWRVYEIHLRDCHDTCAWRM